MQNIYKAWLLQQFLGLLLWSEYIKEGQQEVYSMFNLLTLNSENSLDHLLGASSEEHHDTRLFAVLLARLTLGKKTVRMLPKFQSKRESPRVPLKQTELRSHLPVQSLQVNTLRTVHWLMHKLWYPSGKHPLLGYSHPSWKTKIKDWVAFHLHQRQPLLI